MFENAGLIGLKQIRKIKKYSQLKVAIELNISREALSHYENGKRSPDIQMLRKMSKYFNVSIDYLVGRDYHNDLGYLTSEQKNVMKILKKLNDKNTN